MFRIYGITNPSSSVGSFALINMRLRELDPANYNQLTTIYEADYNLFLNLKNPANTLISTYDSGKRICFVPIAYLQEDDKTLENYIAP